MTRNAEPRPRDADAALVARLRAGDEVAYRDVVRRYHPALVRVAAAHVRSASVAEEVAQDAWLAVLNGLERFEQRSSFRTWLFTICANVAKTRGKRDARVLPFSALAREEEERDLPVEAGNFIEDGHWAQPPAEWRDGEQTLHTSETLERIQAAIEKLPEVQRTVITLRDVRGFESDEVCRLLEISEANQRVLLHRARAKVRKALASDLTRD